MGHMRLVAATDPEAVPQAPRNSMQPSQGRTDSVLHLRDKQYGRIDPGHPQGQRPSRKLFP